MEMAFRLHHVGIVVADLDAGVDEWVRLFGYRTAGAQIHDPAQTAFARFLRLPGDSSYVELVAPDGSGSTLVGALKRGGGLNHLCYATAALDDACVKLQDEGMVMVREPVPAVAFPGRRIAWLMGAGRVLTELVEEGADAW